MLYSCTHLPYIEVKPKVDYEEMFLLQVQMTDELVGLVLVYRQLNYLPGNIGSLCNLIKNSAENNQKLIILGDFNYPKSDWSKISTVHEDHSNDFFLEALRDAFLDQHIRDMTRFRPLYQPSLFALLLTKQAITLKSVDVKPPIGKVATH